MSTPMMIVSPEQLVALRELRQMAQTIREANIDKTLTYDARRTVDEVQLVTEYLDEFKPRDAMERLARLQDEVNALLLTISKLLDTAPKPVVSYLRHYEEGLLNRAAVLWPVHLGRVHLWDQR